MAALGINPFHRTYQVLAEKPSQMSETGLYGVTMIRLGPVKGWGDWVDAQFIDDIVAYAANNPNGFKVRYGHPSFFGPDKIGTELGIATNWRKSEDGNKVLADIQWVRTPETTGKIDHIVTWAKGGPGFIGNSIEFDGINAVTKDGSGNMQPDLVEHQGSQYQRVIFRSLSATAIVSDPAATDGLYAVPANSKAYAADMLGTVERDAPALVHFFAQNTEIAERLFGILLASLKQNIKS